MDDKAILRRFVAALLIGLTGVVGALLLSRGVSARPMAQETGADLAVSKAGSPATVVAGETLTYTLTIANNGPSDATGVTLTDTLPSGVSFDSATSSQGTYNSVTGVWAVGPVADGGSATLTLVVTVDPSTRGALFNWAEVSAAEPDPTPGNNEVVEGTTVSAEADLAMAKVDDPDPVIAGERVMYMLTITNNGPSDATGVTVAEALPSAVSFDWATPSQGTYNSVTGVWTVGSVADGGSATLILVVTVDPSKRGTLSNSAEVSADETDPAPGNNTAVEGTTVSAQADLVVTKTDDPDPVTAGEPLTYVLSITNNGPSDATGVVVTDTLPAGVSFDSATPSRGTYNSVTGVWTVGSVADGNGATLTLVVMVDPATREALFNIAEASAVESDPSPGNNVTVTKTTVSAVANLAITKTDDPDPVAAGELLTYTLTVTNHGPSDATGGVITDTLDPHLGYASASPTPSGFDDGDPYWSLAPLGAGDSRQITLRVQVHTPLPNNTALTNIAWLDAHETAPLSATQETTVHSSPVLTITKTDYPDPVEPGGPLRYTLIITNSGNENATSVTVTERYDPNVSFFYSSPDADPDSGNRVWTFPSVAVGIPEVIDIVVRAASPLPAGTVLTNRATLDSHQTTPVTVTAVTSVTSVSELTVSKVDFPDPVQAGEDLLYFITYQNLGTAPATAVVVTETYDSNVTFVSAEPLPQAGTDNVWDIGDLPVDEGGTIVVTVRVNAPLSDGTVLTNRVSIDSAYTAPRSFTETTRVSSAPGLALRVTDYPDPVEPGDPLTYTLHYTNAGNADATGVVVTATLDSRVSFISATPDPAGGSGEVWYWEIGDVPGQGGYGEIVIRTGVASDLTSDTPLDFAAQMRDAEGDFLEHAVQTRIIVRHYVSWLSFVLSNMVGGTHYVAPWGDDDSPGTWLQPWATLQHAAEAAVAGDVIVFEDGTYEIGPGQSSWTDGTAAMPITFRARSRRQVVWKKSADGGPLLDLEGHSYLKFEGIVLDGDFSTNGWDAWPFVRFKHSHHITFRDCELVDHRASSFWMSTGTHDVTIEDCEVNPNNYQDGESHDGVLMNGGGIKDVTIRRSVFKNIDHVGIYIESCDGFLIEDTVVHTTHSHAVQFGTPKEVKPPAGWVIRGEIRDCTIHGSERFGPNAPSTHHGIYITGRDVSAVTVLRCDIYDTDASGIHVGDNVAGPVEIYHNTIYAANRGEYEDKGAINLYSRISPVVRVKNNIFYTTRTVGMAMRIDERINRKVDLDYNLWYSDADARQGIYRDRELYDTYAGYQDAGYEPHSLVNRNPRFTDAAGADFTLRADSPAIDAGVDVGLPYAGSAPDMGAHEYSALGSTYRVPASLRVRNGRAVSHWRLW